MIIVGSECILSFNKFIDILVANISGVMSHPLFGLVDYIVFGVVLVVTASIGIFYAWRGAGRSTADYLTAKQQLGIFPVSMSVAAG